MMYIRSVSTKNRIESENLFLWWWGLYFALPILALYPTSTFFVVLGGGGGGVFPFAYLRNFRENGHYML